MFKLTLLIVALALAGTQVSAQKTVAELVSTNKDFTILLAAVKVADPSILATLSDPKLAATVFAPTDKAFKRLLKALKLTPEALLANVDLVNKVLAYHVVGMPVASTDLPLRLRNVQTLLPGKNGQYVKITKKTRHGQTAVRIYTSSGASALVIKPDIKVGKTFVHVINRVMIPK